ncbi:MAG: pentapeptide repeat-containing protein, partial [Proteobacteria bacterium]|nr:pentapeptide repeat-containing protein [Pseudomonadota bacterium]
SCNFYCCKLDYSIFQGLKIRGFKFKDCVMKEADFSASQLVGSDFSGALLDGTSFDRADLSKADFRTAKNYQINPLSSKIIGAKFRFPEAMSLVSALGAEIDY